MPRDWIVGSAWGTLLALALGVGCGAKSGLEPGESFQSGSSGSAGSTQSGSAGASSSVPPPSTFERLETLPPDKIDLLFVIDNSISMADKQALFREAVPLLVERLITPACVDSSGAPLGPFSGNDGACEVGQAEFQPVRDIHIAVITSSLGTQAGQICRTENLGSNDHAWLLPYVRPGLPSWNDSGFLAWDPEQNRKVPAGEGSAQKLVSDFKDMVGAVRDFGCGHESTLEAWYRFLIDPDPPSRVIVDSNNVSQAIYPDSAILAQRANFLRSDSLVGIVMLTDENDCSVLDFGQGWLISTVTLNGMGFRLPRATSTCDFDPNHECCFSCLAVDPSPNCPKPAEDPGCLRGDVFSDEINLRCHDQKRRFGTDLLFPIDRYLKGLSASSLLDRSGRSVRNPLFQVGPSGLSRDLSRVFLVGIVGVPWQDIAEAADIEDPSRLRYLDHDELVAQDRWSLVLGSDGARPRDGLMFETQADRSELGFGPHPLTGESIAPASSLNPLQNRINGHESNLDDAELQYACIFPLQEPRDCQVEEHCDCTDTELEKNRALCQPPTGGPATTTQYFGKASPGVRHLELLRAFGAINGNAVVASICPKLSQAPLPAVEPAYGYNAAIAAMVERMKTTLAPDCLEAALPLLPDRRLDCQVLEVAPAGAECPRCDIPGQATPDPMLRGSFIAGLRRARHCGGPGQPGCEELCVCEIQQLSGAGLNLCQSQPDLPTTVAGFCYVDDRFGSAATTLLEHCPVDRKRQIRFVGENVPQSGMSAFLVCD